SAFSGSEKSRDYSLVKTANAREQVAQVFRCLFREPQALRWCKPQQLLHHRSIDARIHGVAVADRTENLIVLRGGHLDRWLCRTHKRNSTNPPPSCYHSDSACAARKPARPPEQQISRGA